MADIAIDIGYLEQQSYDLKHLSQTYQTKKNYPESLDFYQKYITMRDSIVNDQEQEKRNRTTLNAV